jgi:ribosomal protein S18 acetylase RimI-like enzyme
MADASMQEGLPSVQLRLATQTDLPILACIHKVAYTRSHFTALLPDQTLVFYYSHFLTDGAEITLAVHGDEVLGFAVYGTQLPTRIAKFKKTAAPDILMTSIRNPVIAARKLLSAVLAGLAAKPALVPAEFLLLSIAVAKPGRGVGGHLLSHLTLAAQQRHEPTVGLYVNADNTNAINAYFASGFVIRRHQNGQFYMEKHLEK